MLQTNLNNFFIITSVVVGLFAILLIWVYLWETSRGLKITEIQIYKNYVNCSFAFALVMLYSLDYHPRVGFKINDLFFDFNCRLDSYCNWNFNFFCYCKK